MTLDILLARLAPGGRDFERLCKWLLENVPEYRSQLKQVWLWDDWPGRRGRDIGVDLVAEDHEDFVMSQIGRGRSSPTLSEALLSECR